MISKGGFLERLRIIHDLLIKNDSVRDIFSVSDDAKTDKAFYSIEAYSSIEWDRVFTCFQSTVKYLVEYAYKNDDENEEEMTFCELIYEFYHYSLENDSHPSLVFEFNDGERLLLLKTQVLLLMFAVSASITKDVSKLIDPENLNLLRPSSDEVFYRGQSDESYKLIPSLFREYDTSRYGQVMDYSTLYKLYAVPSLTTKYQEVFGGLLNIDDDFCAFMQHSCAYSPFLDLTRKHVVALSFATHNEGNLNTYFKKKSAVFEFRFKKDVLSEYTDVSRTNVYFSNSKLSFFSVFQDSYLFYCVPQAFNPVVGILRNKTNDRMKYQDGAFLFFQQCVVVYGHILMPYAIGRIIKYTIKPYRGKSRIPLSKATIYQKIVKDYRKYDYEHLMNPYLYFSEVVK